MRFSRSTWVRGVVSVLIVWHEQCGGPHIAGSTLDDKQTKFQNRLSKTVLQPPLPRGQFQAPCLVRWMWPATYSRLSDLLHSQAMDVTFRLPAR